MARLSVSAWMRSAGLRYRLRELRARPSGSRTMGQTTISCGEAQVGDHAAQHGNLGGVLLAEEGAVGLAGDEQLGDHGGYAAKVAGAGFAVEAVAQAFHLDKSGCAGGIQLLDRGGEDDSAPSAWARAQSASKVRG